MLKRVSNLFLGAIFGIKGFILYLLLAAQFMRLKKSKKTKLKESSCCNIWIKLRENKFWNIFEEYCKKEKYCIICYFSSKFNLKIVDGSIIQVNFNYFPILILALIILYNEKHLQNPQRSRQNDYTPPIKTFIFFNMAAWIRWFICWVFWIFPTSPIPTT